MENTDTISDILDNLMIIILSPLSNNNTNININESNENNNTLEADGSVGSVGALGALGGNVEANTDDIIFNQVLQSSLNDKFTYKYILSEEGESQLKTIKFTKELKDINNCCPIMSTEFEENQNIISLPCSHYFEPDAINKWVREEKAECPVCRFKLHAKEVKIDEKNYIREDVYSLINLYRSGVNLINSLSRVSYAYNPFSDSYFNMLAREREIYEENNDLIQNITYSIFRNF